MFETTIAQDKKIAKEVEHICDHLQRKFPSFVSLYNTVQTVRATGETGDRLISRTFLDNGGLDPEFVQSLRGYNVKQILSLSATTTKSEHSIFPYLSTLTHYELEPNMPWKRFHALYDSIGIDLRINTPPKVFRFNKLFLELVENLQIAFPGEKTNVLELFLVEIMLKSPFQVYNAFKTSVSGTEFMAPAMEISVTKMVEGQTHHFQGEAFKKLFLGLPYIHQMNISKKAWEKQYEKHAENQKFVIVTFSELCAEIAGLPATLIPLDYIALTKNRIVQLIGQKSREEMVNADGSVNKTFVLSSAMQIAQEFCQSNVFDGLKNALDNETFDCDIECIQNILSSTPQGMHEDLRLLLEASTVNSKDPFPSFQHDNTK